ncbi:hypothetical protein K493DRAFT_355173 [Basidiobolus meristosporus CBS 931.73]|uniref:CoA-dependent acyltransferase n=1 Tax=Basidiobolus meristosporus CBS 931.73 TaxID=1314790 RepID=A0A1Y1Y1C7_9FUNG|nr:hypothetical protein K493DRAFT_355173 [Basidiobolus meristosporus CBS 931.73]|eukprot:ORX91821.1 hypothetical protein K493DRAFT_355173 [Basidiobolus meristosporus CBS 931.73]
MSTQQFAKSLYKAHSSPANSTDLTNYQYSIPQSTQRHQSTNKPEFSIKHFFDFVPSTEKLTFGGSSLNLFPLLNGSGFGSGHDLNNNYSTDDNEFDLEDLFDTLPSGSAKVDFTWYERSEDTSVELALESEVNKKFPENDDQPLWRVWAVAADADGEFNTFELGITVHHAVADGLSSSNIVHTLTRAFLADPITIPYDPETDTKVTELSSSIHTILPNCKPPISVLLKEAATKLLLPKFLRPKEVYWSGTKTLDLDTIQRISAKPRQYPTKLLTMTVPLDSLVQKCTQHNTTVHAALATAFILATHVLKPQHPMKFATPINLRPYCEPVLPRESIGVYVSELMTTHPPPQASDIENFWPMAVQFKEQMNASLEVASAHNNGHRSSLEISNLGRQDWKDLPESPFHVDELGFAQSVSHYRTSVYSFGSHVEEQLELIYGRIVEAVETTFWSNFNLRATIDFPTEKVHYLSSDKAKVDFTWYERSEDTSVELALESEVNRKFPEAEDQPLWRVWAVAADVEFSTFELGVTVHHAFADGLRYRELLTHGDAIQGASKCSVGESHLYYRINGVRPQLSAVVAYRERVLGS